ncbi:ScbR family autoregulator-binding transcription factor [Streptomyces drozdowiczii]|uniref:ScbR family autoregulator-binding transcription factor n=1 Tax=Streptomyces drozdowiczii TaxID=202862 RepID=UPI0031BBBD62
MVATRDPKQERAIRTRDLIVRAAAEVFEESGYHAASVAKISAKAGVTQGALYFHFKTKQAIAQEVMHAQSSFVQIPDEGRGLQRLLDVNFYLARELQRNVLFRAGVRLAVEQGEIGIQDASAYQGWADQFHEILVEAREEGELLADVDEREFAQVLVGAYSGTQLYSKVATGSVDLIERIASLWRYLLPGIATAEALARLSVRPNWAEPRG